MLGTGCIRMLITVGELSQNDVVVKRVGPGLGGCWKRTRTGGRRRRKGRGAGWVSG